MRKVLALVLALLMVFSATLTVSAEEEPVKLDFFIVSPWVTSETPDPEIDIYKKWFDEKFGVDVTLYNPAEGETELLTRITAGNAPDLICFANYNQMQKFYEQGVLIEDWTPYADQIPEFLEAMGEQQVTYCTRDGKLTTLATKPGDQYWGWMIRKDWLANLNMEMPTSLDELYDVLYAFTYNDPDGNGVDDTYGITAAGGGAGVGELGKLLLMFSNPEWHIGENGEVAHPILTGAYEEYLQFVKKLYDAKVIDPNWYTQGWEERKSQLFAGSFGLCWYPPLALYEEFIVARQDEVAADWWELMPTFAGKLESFPITGASTLSVSAQTAQDPAKMEKVCAIINTMQPSNPLYYEIVHGINFDGYRMIELEDGTKYTYRDEETWPLGVPFAEGGVMRTGDLGGYIATACYAQMWRATNADGVILSSSPTPDDYFMAKVAENAKCLDAERYSSESRYLNLDSSVLEEANLVMDEYTIKYILGEKDDYDGFVASWLASGGGELQEQATEQFRNWGFIE